MKKMLIMLFSLLSLFGFSQKEIKFEIGVETYTINTYTTFKGLHFAIYDDILSQYDPEPLILNKTEILDIKRAYLLFNTKEDNLKFEINKEYCLVIDKNSSIKFYNSNKHILLKCNNYIRFLSEIFKILENYDN